MIRRRSVLIGIVLSLSLLAVPAAVLAARDTGSNLATTTAFPGRSITTRAEHQPFNRQRSLVRHRAAIVAGTATADIQVSYDGFTAEAQAAFEAAVSIWEQILVSSQVIHVDASWTPLGANILGSAGPNGFYLAGDGFVYPWATMEAKCSCNKPAPPGETAEITANFSSSFSDWYLGTDGNVPNGKWDFVSVVLHELGHGLGFMSSFEVFNGRGYWGFTNDGVTVYPLRYDSYERTAATAGASLIKAYNNGSAAMKTQLTDGTVFFAGPATVAAAGGRVKLFAPSPWQQGSSNSHVDQARYDATAESLMTPALVDGQSDGAPGPITIAMMQDIGWTVTTSGGGGGAPANDNFADASAANLKVSKTATTTEATLETAEPQPTCATATDKTVWYRYTPGINRTVIALTAGSDFDTVLVAYTGSDLASLSPVACNDNRAVDNLSKLKLTLTAGTTYWFQVGGANGESGSLTFRLKKPL